MTHRIGGGTWDQHLNARLAIRSGVITGTEIWGRQWTTRGGEIGVPKGGHFGCSRSGVSSMVYLHAGLEIRSAIPYTIDWASN